MARGGKSLLLVLSLISGLAVVASAQPPYQETIVVMHAVYGGEVLAHARYQAIAAKAMQEKYPHIAYLAVALAGSEAIHARNFRSVLTGLGQTPDDRQPDVRVSDTRANLKLAANAELDEIDTRYPRYIKRIQAESHPEAIEALSHAWAAEKQHRELLAQLLSGTGIFFGVLVKTIEENPVTYFVCQTCGSTLVELPKHTCPICGGPVSNYKLVDPPR